MLRTYLLPGLVCVILAAPLFAAAPPPSPEAVEAQRLVEQLGHRNWRVRERAERRLLVIARHALPRVRDAQGSRNSAIRRRAIELVPALETAILLAPRRVTFSVRNQPLQKVLEELKKASGYQIFHQSLMGPVGQGETKYTYDFVDVPFWDVINRLCRDASLTVQQSWGNDNVWLNQTNTPGPHMSRSGPFRINATSVQLSRTLDLATPHPDPVARAGNLTFHFEMAAEPRLPFVRAGTPKLVAAYDEENQSLVPLASPPSAQPQAQVTHGVKPLGLTASVSLQRRSARSRTLKELRGTLAVDVLSSEKPVVLTAKVLEAKGKKLTMEGIEFTIQEARKENNRFHLALTMTSTREDVFGYHLYYRFEVFDTKGTKLSWNSAGMGHSRNSANLNMDYPLPAGKDTTPAKLVFLAWETKRVTIPFEFRDILLP
jgi:hypothetical protein